MSIALSLLDLVTDHKYARLLGGLLRFLSYQDTIQVLHSWAPERRLAGQLARFSEHLALDFPSIDLPSSSPRIDTQFPKQVTTNYLAVQFSTRRPPNVSPLDQSKVTCLRVWLLLKSLEFSDSGSRYELNLFQICTQVRMALDDKGDTRKLAWFLSLLEPAATVQEFELSLDEKTRIRKPDAPHGATETLRAIGAVLNNERRPAPIGVCNGIPFTIPQEWLRKASFPSQPPVLALDESVPGVLDLPASGQEEGARYMEISVSENSTPPEIVRRANGIAFQSQEDLQYLPHSWNRLQRHERQAMDDVIQARLVKGTAGEKLLAAFTLVAIICRRSMETVETLALGATPADEWQLDLAGGRLHRLPSRRAVRWRADDAAQEWIKTLCPSWDIHFTPPIARVLSDAARLRPHARTVSELWPDDDFRMETAFNTWCRDTPGLQRVSSGLLVRVSEQVAFEQSFDSTFAHLVTSPVRAGIAGSGAYPSWSLSEVARNFVTVGAPHVTQACDEHLNALGSELDPDDTLLSKTMATACAVVGQLSAARTDWVQYHNHLTAYTVMSLLAATGARPVESMFQSSAHFNFEEELAYIDDKVSPQAKVGESGRIVPLPSQVVTFLREVYFTHLLHVAAGLPPQLEHLSAELKKQATGQGSDKIPLFFLLRLRPDFEWFAVSESTLSALRFLKWPLPFNLFRHRMAVRLRTARLNCELIDAQMGHAEAGAQTFGDDSPRCWKNDLPQWRVAITAAFDLLKLDFPTTSTPEIGDIVLAPDYQAFAERSLFGAAARAQERKKRHDHAVKRADEEILRFVGRRPIQSIAAVEWEQLGRNMLLTSDNLRHANATIRYETYEKFLSTQWRKKGERPRLRKWLTRLPTPKSAFHSNSIAITESIEPARAALEQVFAQLKPPSTLAKKHAAMVAALDLCLNGKVADVQMLEALADADTQFLRMVVFQKKFHVEYSETMDLAEHPPAVRYLVPTRCARLLESALSAGKKLSPKAGVPSFLQALCIAAGVNWSDEMSINILLRKLATMVDHENKLLMPGVVAGYMGRRVTSYGLRWVDWIRVNTGQAKVDPAPSPAPVSVKRDAPARPFPGTKKPLGVADKNDREKTKSANQMFVRLVRAELRLYRNGQKGASEEEKAVVEVVSPRKNKNRTNTSTASRDLTKDRIKSLLQKPDASVSVATHALGSWVLHLLHRPYKKYLLDAVSIQRYLAALAPGFLSFGYEVDLADLDADELTEFYAQVIDPANGFDAEEDDNRTDKVSAKAKGKTKAKKPRLNQKYVLQRLVDFHRFAQQQYGLESPDWSELGEGVHGSVALPGFITVPEYLHALRSLCPTSAPGCADQVRDAFILLLAYRFGLRAGEAVSLARGSWVEVAGSTVLLVTGKHRSLKTTASLRQVPLLEELHECERQVIECWLDHWSAQTNSNDLIPLFFEDRQRGGVADMRPIRERVILALRQSTGAQHINLHHARHSFANRIGSLLMITAGFTPWPAVVEGGGTTGEQVSRTLLATTELTRRSPWALARLLGHVTSNTTFNSYVHFLSDWSAQVVERSNPTLFADLPDRPLNGITNLDNWAADAKYLASAPAVRAAPPQPRTAHLVMEYLRLRAHGLTPQAATHHCRFKIGDEQVIEQSLRSAGSHLTTIDLLNSEVSAIALPLALLGHVQEHRWNVLIDWVKTRAADSSPPPLDAYDIGLQVGPSRQILLWEKVHFFRLRDFLRWCGWDANQVCLYRPAKLDAMVSEWALDAGFCELNATTLPSPANEIKAPKIKKKGKTDPTIKCFQIDTVMEHRPGLPPERRQNRIAVVRAPLNVDVADTYELIVVWLAYSSSTRMAPL